jgi:hypothetical protein
MHHLEEAIRERAYHLWIADGQPDGNADTYWLNAQREILTTSLGSTAGETAAPVATEAVSVSTNRGKKTKAARSGKGKSRAA